MIGANFAIEYYEVGLEYDERLNRTMIVLQNILSCLLI